MVATAMQQYGRIDVLHNNVGIVEGGGPAEATLESWNHVHDVNLKSVYLTCHAVIPLMVTQGGGAIVNISSIASIRSLGIPYISYQTTKAALNQFSRAVAVQYGPQQVRCNTVLPGLMRTPLVEQSVLSAYPGGDSERYFAERNAVIPLGHFGDAWDVAHAALFFASDDAKYVTGAELVVDGGVTLQTGL
jgi:NAD(P)-dependent dehydrogenase (short-subunit alcohol dehydrogenase family)